MDPTLIQQVWERANATCEYCRLPQAHSIVTFEIDHIIARQHGGKTTLSNLALACFYCNSYKGPNISSIDPQSRKLVPLFNPRRNKWARHFRWVGAELIGRTPMGRATVFILNINGRLRVAHRRELIEQGLFPLPGRD